MNTPSARLPCWGILLLALLLPGFAAADGAGLYEATVPVSGRSAPERQRAVEEGFRQVLVKVSGQRSVLAMPGVKAELARAPTLLSTYTYEAAPARQPGQAMDPGMTPLRLRMSFDSRGTLAILNRAEAPVWGSSRPAVYLWVGKDVAGGRLPWGPDGAQGTVLLDAAAQRGLPVILTLSDTPVPVPQGTGLPPVIVEAASRNNARVVLGASLAGSSGRWKAAGVLVVDGVAERIEAAGADEFSTLRELVAVAADRLGSRLTVVARPDRVQAVVLRVHGVTGVADHAALVRWLAGMPQVRAVVVDTAAASQLEYRLTVAGEIPQLVSTLAADGHLSGVTVPAPGEEPVVLDASLSSLPGR